MIRTVLFWIHLAAGLVCGVVIFIMSFTGAAIALQPQILLWAERDMRRVVPPSDTAPWIGPDALLAAVRTAHPDFIVTGMTREHDPSQAVAITMTDPAAAQSSRGPVPAVTFYADPYSGRLLGQIDPLSPWRRFFRVNTDWHRWLAMTGDQRDTGRWITGVSNAAFLLLALTGLYIWTPRVWSSAAIRSVTLFRGGLSGKARDFNWHNVIGVWSAVVLVVLTFTAMCISFPKTYDVIYWATGIERPPTPSAAPGATPARGAQAARPANAAASPAPTDTRASDAAPTAALPSLDGAWRIAEQQMPTWRSIAMRLPARAGQPVTFTMNDRDRLNPMARSTLTVDPSGPRVARWEPYASLMTGQRLRTWMRFGHTGELWGLPGQLIAGVASAGGCVLVWTGLSLAYRRFTAWLARRRRPAWPLDADRPAA